MKQSHNRYLGIVIAISILVLFEFAILGANFYLSQGIDENAQNINIAGRQRMLSQRISKSLFDAQINFENTELYQKSIDELKGANLLFDETIRAFIEGGKITTAFGDTDQINAITSSDVRAIAQEGLLAWEPLKQKIDRVLSANDSNASILLEEAVLSAENINLVLLKLMNDLTTAIETEANSRASLLRIIQTIGFILLSVMFLGILFFFIRRLIRNDTQLITARNETKQILETVDEGLFLVHKDLTIGDQQSNKLEEIFNTSAIGKHLLEFLDKFISSKDKDTTRDYFDLLFDLRKPEHLISDLNPLKEVDIQLDDGNSRVKRKTLSFSFRRVMNGKKIDNILTTILDITEEIELRKELEKVEHEKNNQMEMLSTILNTDNTALSVFISNTHESLKAVNTLLKKEASNSLELNSKALKILTIIHGVKGESSALGIDTFTKLANQLENKAEKLSKITTLRGEEFIPLTVELKKMIHLRETIESIMQSFSIKPTTHSPLEINNQQWSNLYQLADSVAERQNKNVELITAGLNEHALSEDYKSFIHSVSVQFIRNSISHGIEGIQERMSNGKNATGRLSLTLQQLKDKSFELIFKDDGQGINMEKILEQAIDTNILSDTEAKNISNQKILSLVFHDGFSTSSNVDDDSGRGVGMSLVAKKTKQLGGKIQIKTSAQAGTTFTIAIPKDISAANESNQTNQLHTA